MPDILAPENLKKLMSAKDAEIERGEQCLRRLREERIALEALAHLSRQPSAGFDWNSFLSHLETREPKIAQKLAGAEVKLFDIGKLRVKAPPADAPHLRLYAPLIKAELRQYAGIDYEVHIINDDE